MDKCVREVTGWKKTLNNQNESKYSVIPNTQVALRNC